MAQKKGLGKKTKIAIGVGAGLAAAALGAYLLTGERGKKNRKKLKTMAASVKKEVELELAKLKKASKEDYQAILAEAVKRYKSLEKKPALARTPAKN